MEKGRRNSVSSSHDVSISFRRIIIPLTSSLTFCFLPTRPSFAHKWYEKAMARAGTNIPPISFLSQLLTTTTTPVFVHPMHWSKLHLRLLCVRGLEKELPLEQVFGRMAGSFQKASFVDHVLLFRELGNLDEYHYRCYIALVRPVIDKDYVRRKPIDQSSGVAEELLTSLCFEWLEQIYLQKGFPTRTGRWSLRLV